MSMSARFAASPLAPLVVAALAAAAGLAPQAARAQAAVPTSDLIKYFGRVLPPVPEGKAEGPIPIDGPFFVPNQAVVLYEDADFKFVSDEIYILGSELYFASDVDDKLTLSGAPIVAKLMETGAYQDVGKYFTDADGKVLFPMGELQVLSDADVTVVPEPAAWALMLLGFGGLGALARRRRAPAAA